jgi:hypothetical protein
MMYENVGNFDVPMNNMILIEVHKSLEDVFYISLSFLFGEILLLP